MVLALTDGFNPGIGILVSFLPFLFLFIFIALVSLWSILKLVKLHRLNNKEIVSEAAGSRSYIPIIPSSMLLLGVLYLLKLAAERSIFGVNPQLFTFSLLPSLGEWSSLQNGLALLFVGWVLTMKETKNQRQAKREYTLHTNNVYWLVVVFGLLLSSDSFLGVGIAITGGLLLLRSISSSAQESSSFVQNIKMKLAVIFIVTATLILVFPPGPPSACSNTNHSYSRKSCGGLINSASFLSKDYSIITSGILLSVGVFFYKSSKRENGGL